LTSVLAVALLAQAPVLSANAGGSGVPPAERSPLTLREAVGEALRSSPALGASLDGRQFAGIREEQAASAFGLQVVPTLRAGSTVTGAPELGFGVDVTKRLPFGTELRATVAGSRGGSAFTVPGPTYSIGVAQPLLRGLVGAPAAALKQARREVVASDRALEETQQDLIIAIAAAYLDILQLDRVVGAGEHAVERARRLLVSSRARVKVGLATELDVSRAEYLGAQAEATLLAQRESLDAALDRFKAILGRPLDATVEVALGDLADPGALFDAFVPPAIGDADAMQALTAMAVSGRVEVAEARDRIADAHRAETVARWNLLPDVTLHATYTRAPQIAAGLAPLGLERGWLFGVSTGYQLERGDLSAAAASASISVRAARRTADDVERRVVEEVRRAYREWVRSAGTIELQTRAVGLAERQVRLAQLRAERGIAGNLELVDAEGNLYEAQTALIGAQATRALAGLVLRRAAGGLDPSVYAR
jgi:outer membrane protein TolC